MGREEYSTEEAYPPVLPPATGIPMQWSTGLCGCFSDVSNCCLTCWCPCVTFGQIAEIVDKGSTSCGASGALYALISAVTGCSFIYSCFYRSRMRTEYKLPESPCGDCLVHCCCETCALCQEYRELQHRGFDMSLGWHGNMQWAPSAPFYQGQWEPSAPFDQVQGVPFAPFVGEMCR